MNNETVLISRSFPFFSFLLLFLVCLCQLREHYASPQVKICNIFLLILELLRRASVVAPHFSGRADSASSFLHCTTGWIGEISLFSHDVHNKNLPVQTAQLLHRRGMCLSTNFQPQFAEKNKNKLPRTENSIGQIPGIIDNIYNTFKSAGEGRDQGVGTKPF